MNDLCDNISTQKCSVCDVAYLLIYLLVYLLVYRLVQMVVCDTAQPVSVVCAVHHTDQHYNELSVYSLNKDGCGSSVCTIYTRLPFLHSVLPSSYVIGNGYLTASPQY